MLKFFKSTRGKIAGLLLAVAIPMAAVYGYSQMTEQKTAAGKPTKVPDGTDQIVLSNGVEMKNGVPGWTDQDSVFHSFGTRGKTLAPELDGMDKLRRTKHAARYPVDVRAILRDMCHKEPRAAGQKQTCDGFK